MIERKSWVKRILEVPWIAHVIRAQDRYFSRLGDQFAASITYYSMLSLVPILVFAFSMLGMTLTVFRPDLLQVIQDWVQSVLSGAQMSSQVNGVIDSALRNWQPSLVVGVTTGLWWGAGWILSLKNAIRVQMQEDLDPSEHQKFIVIEFLLNIVMLLAFLVVFGLMAILSGFGSWFIEWVSQFLEWPGGSLILSAAPTLSTVALGWLLFMFIFTVFPAGIWPMKVVVEGALIGSIALSMLLFLTKYLILVFSRNLAFAIFGPVIMMMLFFNLFGKLVLLVAAWIATDTPILIEHQVDDPVAPVIEEEEATPKLTPWTTGFAIGAGAVAGLVAASKFKRKR